MNKLFTFMRESSVARFFIPLGLVLIIFGIFALVVNINNQDYVKTKAAVINVKLFEEEYIDANGDKVEATYSATVKYMVDGKEYEATLDNVSKYKVGEKITIYYNPKDPSQVTQTISLILPIVIIVSGVAVFTGGIVSIVNTVKRNKKMEEQERSWENGK